MIEYTFSEKARLIGQQNETAVKAAICIIAALKLGIEPSPKGIGKYEGGVLINGQEIAIKGAVVKDDWRVETDPTPEEEAVVFAISEVEEYLLNHGIVALAKEFGQCQSRDPLRSLLNLNINGIPN